MSVKKRTNIWANYGPPPTPGAISAPAYMTINSATSNGLTIQYASTTPSTLPAFQVVYSGSTIMQVLKTGPVFFGITAGSAPGVFNDPGCFDGTQSPPCLELPDGGTGTPGYTHFWSGTGVPSSTTVGTANVGDVYYRRNGAGASDVNLYVCTTAGSPGTWTGIA